jgi:tetratricopeptide (TPR) repeat protein
MNKENSLYGIIGLLLGLIIGYAGTNSLNGQPPAPEAAESAQSASLPPNHPPAGGEGSPANGSPQGETMVVIEQARKDPSNFDAQMKAADQFRQINRKEGELEFYLNAVKIKPNDYDLLVRLGDTTFDLARYTDSAKWYEQALKIKPNDPTVQMDLGLTFYLRQPRDLDRAIEQFRAALKSDPRHEKSLQNLTQALIEKGDKNAAADTLKQLEQVSPGNQSIAQFRSKLQ